MVFWKIFRSYTKFPANSNDTQKRTKPISAKNPQENYDNNSDKTFLPFQRLTCARHSRFFPTTNLKNLKQQPHSRSRSSCKKIFAPSQERSSKNSAFLRMQRLSNWFEDHLPLRRRSASRNRANTANVPVDAKRNNAYLSSFRAGIAANEFANNDSSARATTANTLMRRDEKPTKKAEHFSRCAPMYQSMFERVPQQKQQQKETQQRQQQQQTIGRRVDDITRLLPYPMTTSNATMTSCSLSRMTNSKLHKNLKRFDENNMWNSVSTDSFSSTSSDESMRDLASFYSNTSEEYLRAGTATKSQCAGWSARPLTRGEVIVERQIGAASAKAADFERNNALNSRSSFNATPTKRAQKIRTNPWLSNSKSNNNNDNNNNNIVSNNNNGSMRNTNSFNSNLYKKEHNSNKSATMSSSFNGVVCAYARCACASASCTCALHNNNSLNNTYESLKNIGANESIYYSSHNELSIPDSIASVSSFVSFNASNTTPNNMTPIIEDGGAIAQLRNGLLNSSTCSSGYGSQDNSPECSVHSPNWTTNGTARFGEKKNFCNYSEQQRENDYYRSPYNIKCNSKCDVTVTLTGLMSPANAYADYYDANCNTINKQYVCQRESCQDDAHIYHELESLKRLSNCLDEENVAQINARSCASTDEPIYAIPYQNSNRTQHYCAKSPSYFGNNFYGFISSGSSTEDEFADNFQRASYDKHDNGRTRYDEIGGGYDKVMNNSSAAANRPLIAEDDEEADNEDDSMASASSTSTTTTSTSWTPMLRTTACLKHNNDAQRNWQQQEAKVRANEKAPHVAVSAQARPILSENNGEVKRGKKVDEINLLAELDQQIAELQLQSDAVKGLVEQAKARHEMRAKTRRLCMQHLKELREIRWMMRNHFELCI